MPKKKYSINWEDDFPSTYEVDGVQYEWTTFANTLKYVSWRPAPILATCSVWRAHRFSCPFFRFCQDPFD